MLLPCLCVASTCIDGIVAANESLVQEDVVAAAFAEDDAGSDFSEDDPDDPVDDEDEAMEADEDFGLESEADEQLSARQQTNIVAKMAQGVRVVLSVIVPSVVILNKPPIDSSLRFSRRSRRQFPLDAAPWPSRSSCPGLEQGL